MFASNRDRVVVGQPGRNELLFYRHDGTLERTIVLKKHPDEVTFRERTDVSAANTRRSSSAKVLSDNRLPSLLTLRDITVGDQYTVVSGTFEHEGHRRTLAIVDHGSWNVSYPVGRAFCSNPQLDGNRLVCLHSNPLMEDPVIHIYSIVSE